MSTQLGPGRPDDVALYSLTDGKQQTITPSPGMAPQCPLPDVETECSSADAVGANWIEWDASCYNCAVTSFFQNIQTGELRDDPTNATTFADLNSPTLAHKTCPGVRLMPGNPPTRSGLLTYEGQFALVTIGDDVFLERCGTRMRRLLGGEGRASLALASNAGAIVWQAVTSELTGLLLPSLQRFTIPLPSAIVRPPGATQDTSVSGLALTSGALYVSDGWAGTVWRTASPTELPLNTSRSELARSGDTLTCKRGRWRHAVAFSYAWRINGVTQKHVKPTLAVRKARQQHSVSCSVTASNAAGKTTAASAHQLAPLLWA